MTARPALLFYCQHSVGLGHLMRSLRAVPRRSPSASASCCSAAATLPGGHRRAAGRRARRAAAARRRRPTAARSATTRAAPSERALGASGAERILATLRRRPAGGRARRAVPVRPREVRRELVPLLEAAPRRRRRPLIACSLRDILVAAATTRPRTTSARRARRTRYFDAVLVHADPRFARLEETFQPGHAAARARPLHRLRRPAGDRAAPAAGAGAAARRRLRRRRPRRRAAAARRGRGAPRCSPRRPMRVIAGPFLPEAGLAARCATRPPAADRLELRPLGARPRRRARPRGGVASASAATTPRSTSSAPASRRSSSRTPTAGEDEQTAPRRAARRARRACACSTAARLDGPQRWRPQLAALLALPPAPVALDLDGAAQTARACSPARRSRRRSEAAR